jgi:hypothetical protein
MIDTSKITTHITQSLKVPIVNIINTTVEVKVNETVLSLCTDINEIKTNVRLLEQEVKDQREITLKSLNKVKNDSKNYCDSESLRMVFTVSFSSLIPSFIATSSVFSTFVLDSTISSMIEVQNHNNSCYHFSPYSKI